MCLGFVISLEEIPNVSSVPVPSVFHFSFTLLKFLSWPSCSNFYFYMQFLKKSIYIKYHSMHTKGARKENFILDFFLYSLNLLITVYMSLFHQKEKGLTWPVGL